MAGRARLGLWQAAPKLRPGARVVVFGPGPIGQGAAIFARKAGADVAVVGHGDAARFATLRRLGFDTLIDLAEPDGAAQLTGVPVPSATNCNAWA